MIVVAKGNLLLGKTEPYLLFKARTHLAENTSKWNDGRSNRMPTEKELLQVKEAIMKTQITYSAF